MTRTSFRLTLAVFTLIIAIGTVGFWRYRTSRPAPIVSPPSAASEVSDEYAVYSALLKKSFLEDGVKLLVIQNRTLFYANPDYLKSTTSERRVQEMKGYYPSVDESALQDFDSKHIESTEITPHFDLPVKYVIVNKDDFDESANKKARQLFPDFSQRYPDARGIIALSRVGFNKTRDQAFVSVEFTFCPLCGHGDRLFLKKESGVWAVVETFVGWVS